MRTLMRMSNGFAQRTAGGFCEELIGRQHPLIWLLSQRSCELEIFLTISSRFAATRLSYQQFTVRRGLSSTGCLYSMISRPNARTMTRTTRNVLVYSTSHSPAQDGKSFVLDRCRTCTSHTTVIRSDGEYH